jgi:hypothetical protein
MALAVICGQGRGISPAAIAERPPVSAALSPRRWGMLHKNEELHGFAPLMSGPAVRLAVNLCTCEAFQIEALWRNRHRWMQ